MEKIIRKNFIYHKLKIYHSYSIIKIIKKKKKKNFFLLYNSNCIYKNVLNYKIYFNLILFIIVLRDIYLKGLYIFRLSIIFSLCLFY